MLEQSRGLSCVGAHGVLGPATLETQVVDERLEDRLVVVAGPGTATCGHATSVSHGRGPLQLMGRAGHVGLWPPPCRPDRAAPAGPAARRRHVGCIIAPGRS